MYDKKKKNKEYHVKFVCFPYPTHMEQRLTSNFCECDHELAFVPLNYIALAQYVAAKANAEIIFI